MSTTTSRTAPTAAPVGAALRLVGAEEVGDEHRHRDRNSFRDEEHDLQGHALGLESHCLRRRAERYVHALEHGAVVEDDRVQEVLRAFRAYRPFLFVRDRDRNDAAGRRLARAARAIAATARDASVA